MGNGMEREETTQRCPKRFVFTPYTCRNLKLLMVPTLRNTRPLTSARYVRALPVLQFRGGARTSFSRPWLLLYRYYCGISMMSSRRSRERTSEITTRTLTPGLRAGDRVADNVVVFQSSRNPGVCLCRLSKFVGLAKFLVFVLSLPYFL